MQHRGSSTTENPAGQAPRHRGKRSDLLYVRKRGSEGEILFFLSLLRRSRFSAKLLVKTCIRSSPGVYALFYGSIHLSSTSLEFEKEWRLFVFLFRSSRSCVYTYIYIYILLRLDNCTMFYRIASTRRREDTKTRDICKYTITHILFFVTRWKSFRRGR